MGGKKKKKRKTRLFKPENKITYNTVTPNREARRLGVVAAEPPSQEENKRETKIVVLNRKVQQARELQQRIVPCGKTYREYLQYLNGRKKKLEEKGKITTGGKNNEDDCNY